MPAPRKKWSTTTQPWNRKSHESKAAAYRYVRQLAGQFAAGILRADVKQVKVWSDDGRGRGWELYETIGLKDLTP